MLRNYKGLQFRQLWNFGTLSAVNKLKEHLFYMNGYFEKTVFVISC